MKMFKAVSVLLVLALSACGGSVSDARNAVSKQLLDPASAEFSQVSSFEGGVVCGLVNAKNRMGGFAGVQAFVYTGLDKNSVKLGASESDVQAWCGNTNPRTQLVALEKMCEDAKSNPAMESNRATICGNMEKLKQNISSY